MSTNITIKSQLMKNHVAGKVLPRQKHLATAKSATGAPFLFALDSEGKLTLALPSSTSTSGWDHLDLTRQVPKVGKEGVAAFSLSQGVDGAISLAVAPASSSGVAEVYVSTTLPEHSSFDDWQNLGSKFVKRTLPENVRVNSLELGVVVQGNPTPLLVVEGKGSDGQVHHFQVNPNPEDSSWSALTLTFPQNATTCLAAIPGYLQEHGVGVYALCQVGVRTALTFTPLPQVFGGHPVTKPAIDLGIPEGATLASIDSVVRNDGQTELYLGGSGLWYYSVATQATSNLQPTVIDDGTAFAGVKQLAVSAEPDGTHIGVWGATAADVLMYTRGNPSDLKTWQTPVPLDTEVTALDSYVSMDEENGPNTVCFLGYSDGSVGLYAQDSVSKLWRKQEVSTAAMDSVRELNTYTTRILLQDDDGMPLNEETVSIEPSFDCAVMVNGKYHLLEKGVPKPITSTADGRIVLVLQTEALEAPVYTVQTQSGAHQEDPVRNVRNSLAKYNSGSVVAEARKSDGSKLFPDGVSDETADTAADAIETLVNIYDSLPADGSVHPAAKTIQKKASHELKRTVLFAAHSTERGHLTLLNAQAKLEELSLQHFFVEAGDILSALWSDVEEIGSFFLNTLEEGFEFLVEIGGKVIGFVFEVGAQVFGVVNWVMNRLFGFDLNTIVEWLGFVFDWGAILETHRVLRRLMELNVGYTRDQIDRLEDLTEKGFEKVRKAIAGGLSVDTSNEIFQKRVRNNPAAEQQVPGGPQGSWASDHVGNGLALSSSTSVNFLQDFTQLLVGMAEREGEILKNALQQVSTDLVEDFDSLTWGQVVQKLLEILAEALVNSAENVVLGLMDAAKILLSVVEPILEARWEIPIVTYVYEELICQGDGSKLTMLDLACLVASVPASIIYRAATHQPLFPEDTAAAIESAKTFPEAVQALSEMKPPLLDRQRACRISSQICRVCTHFSQFSKR